MNKRCQPHNKLDKRNHLELPLLDQLNGLGWVALICKPNKPQAKPTAAT